jgi:hypothetical protein
VTVPKLVCTCLLAFIGLGIGLGSTLPGADLLAWTAACVGLSLGVCTWVFHGAAVAQRMYRHWGEVSVRLLGSWAIAGVFLVFVGVMAEPSISELTGGAVLH